MAPPPEEERGGGGCCARWLRREVLLALALGQLVSLLITSTGFSSSELARRGINAPTSQSLLNYILLALVYGGILLYRRQPLTGDLLVIVGSMLYACSNVTEEYLVKKNNRIELMAMLGIFGAVISGIQISILEREELHLIKWNAGTVFPFIGFALAMFLFYSTVPTVLKICRATMLNLSLLTSDMWAVLIRIFAYHEKVDWMYFVAFACTVGGLLVYSYRSSKEADDTAQVTGASDVQSRVGDEESGIQNQVRSSFAGGNDHQASYKELPSNGSPSKN